MKKLEVRFPTHSLCLGNKDSQKAKGCWLGSAFAVERLKVEDLKEGMVNSSWRPKPDHPAISREHIDALSGMLLAGFSLGISVGALNVSDEWNRIFPDYKFVQPKEFLSEAWSGKS